VGKVRVVECVFVREHGHVDQIARVCGPPATAQPSLRVAEYADNNSEAGIASIGRAGRGKGHKLAGKDVAALARTVPHADEPHEQSRRTAQAARRRACTAPRRGSRPRLSRGAVDARVACAVVRVYELAAQHPLPGQEDAAS
jgi:hypothetical protein